MVELAERQLRQLDTDTSHIACGPGCGTCCVVNVNILEPEALAITYYVTQNFSVEEQQALCKRLQELDRATRWLDDEERMMVRKPCAFLDAKQNCSIHPARPLLCRSVTSTDPVRCRDALAMIALGEAPQILSHLEQKQLFENAYLGLSQALEDHGLDKQCYRLADILCRSLH